MPLSNNDAKGSSNYSKMKFLKEWHQLKFQAKTLERERSAQVLVRNGEYKKLFSQLQEVEVGVERDIKNEAHRIQTQLQRLSNKVTSFQSQLKDVQLTPEFLEHLKVNMESVESAVTEFKEQQQHLFENLLTEQESVEHDIEIIQKRLQTLNTKEREHDPSSGKKKIVSNFQNHASSNLPHEVKAFEKYVAQFGQQGGWDDYDHGTFTKIRSRFKNKASFIKSAVENIPGYDENDIKEHEAWYSTFLELKEAKKLAILQWKIKKEQEQKENAIPVVEEDTEDMEQMRKEKLKLEEERAHKKEEVSRWKKEKAEKLKLEAQLKADQERKLQHIKDRKKQQMDQVRQAAKIRMQEKREEQEREMWRIEAEQEEILTARSEAASKEISRFQTRDKLALNFKMQEKKRKQKEEDLKAERLARLKRNVEVHVESDRSRLYQPTDAWLNRTYQNSSRPGSASQPMLNVPHRAIPSWRQGL